MALEMTDQSKKRLNLRCIFQPISGDRERLVGMCT